MQAQGTPQHPQTYTSTLDVFRKTFEKDGIRGFYKGMVPTLTKVCHCDSSSRTDLFLLQAANTLISFLTSLQVVPAVSISYVVYEYSKRELGL